MKVLLLHGRSCDNELKSTRLWLEAEGCEVVIFDLHSSFDALQKKAVTELAQECDTLVFLVNSDLPLDEVQVLVLAANAKGKKVVSVQLGASVSIDVFEKYGCASVPLKRALIVGAVCEDRYAWIDDDGEPREEPETERHKCKKKKLTEKNAAA
jgi:hypothetical protein